MNYNSKITIRPLENVELRHSVKMKDRLDKVIKFYNGWYGISNRTTARAWLNKELNYENQEDAELIREIDNELLRRHCDERFSGTVVHS